MQMFAQLQSLPTDFISIDVRTVCVKSEINETKDEFIEALTVRESIPVMIPVLIARARWEPWKNNMFEEGGLRPLGKCPICRDTTSESGIVQHKY